MLLPFRYTIRMISMKYRKGLNRVNVCAQSGMLAIGVNNPLIKINIIKKKNMTNKACCIVDEWLDIINPNPDSTRIYRNTER